MENEQGTRDEIMKEGYIQTKMRELDEMVKQMKNECLQLGIRLQNTDRKIGDYEILLSKLNDMEKLRLTVSETLSKKNESLINTFYDNIHKELPKLVITSIDNKMKETNTLLSKIDGVLHYLHEFENLGMILQSEYCISRTLINQMLKKNIFSKDEVDLLFIDAERMFKREKRKRTNYWTETYGYIDDRTMKKTK